MSIKVAVLGATGETGRSIVRGLLKSSTKFDITVLTRPVSLGKPALANMASKGVKIIATDLRGSEIEVVKALEGIDILISAIDPGELTDQIVLASAAKTAGVKRFVPCMFGTVAPPRGVMVLRDPKEDVLNHTKKIYLPYTVIDIGWWYQLSIPRLPSGRVDSLLFTLETNLAGAGDIPWARTDLNDIGPYVARIIVDERTLNKYVFAYADLSSQNDVIALMEKLSKEKIEFTRFSKEELEKKSAELRQSKNPDDTVKTWHTEYLYSQGIRGDNTPEYARYLGYLDGRELYPDLKLKSLESFFKDILDGKGKPIYEEKLAI